MAAIVSEYTFTSPLTGKTLVANRVQLASGRTVNLFSRFESDAAAISAAESKAIAEDARTARLAAERAAVARKLARRFA